MEGIIVILSWIIIGIFVGLKQWYAGDGKSEGLWILAFCLAPLWFLGALIRQFIIRDWE